MDNTENKETPNPPTVDTQTVDTTPVAEPVVETVVEQAPPKRGRGRPKGSKNKPKVVIVRGQSAEPLDMTFDQFNAKEHRILGILDPNGYGTRTVLTLGELVSATGWGKRYGQGKGNSRVRNNLRRLVREGFVEHPEDLRDGKYRITQRGRNAQNKALGRTKPVQPPAIEATEETFLPVVEVAPVEIEAAQTL